MRVLLINPTANFEVVGSNPMALEESRGHSPPLGLLLLASYLEEHSDHEVSFLDAKAEELSFQEIASSIRRARPDVVGITVMTHTILDAVRIIEISRKQAPDAKIVLGGPHVYLFPDESIGLPGVDFAVLGEGEAVFKELLDNIGDPAALRSIPGIVFEDDGEVINTGPSVAVKDLDSLPFPARHLTNIGLYDSVLLPHSPVTTLFTSRGCPYSCSFCDRPHLGKRFRARSAGNVVDEIQSCVEIGIREFLIYDDTFTVRKRRVFDICNEILKRGLDIDYDVRARTDTVDQEMLNLMAKSGCKGIHYGVEAGTEKILKVLKKGIDLKKSKRVFRETKSAGIQVLAYFMIGSPTETVDDIRETFRVAKEMDPDFLHLTILTPFPGTEIYRKGLESGVIESDVWREFAAHPDMGFVPPHWPENFTIDELNELLIEGYRGFYRRPVYLLKRLTQIRSPEELIRKSMAGMRVLTMKSKAQRKRRSR